MKVLVIGAGGMLGRYMVEHCTAQGDTLVAHDRRSLDITDADALHQAFDEAQPEAVFNCAAWTDVDACESNVERAFATNSLAVERMADLSRRHAAVFVTVSTDYVFDGTRMGFYTQRDDPQPPSVYGKAKLDGERRALAASARTIVVRTGWLYGAGGRNFLSVISARAAEFHRARMLAKLSSQVHTDATVPAGEASIPAVAMRAIADAYGMPTAAIDLARRMRELAEFDLPGVYHVVADGEPASYADFAREAFTSAGDAITRIENTSADALARPAPRPRNSCMQCLLSDAVGLPRLPAWKESLRSFIIGSAD